MDPLKKIIADRLKAQLAGPHPGAEVLSAFAENALPVNERETVLQHLSVCSDCRDIVFLAAPLTGEPQQVVSAPKAPPHFALRWGTLAACMVIVAVFLVSRHQTTRTEFDKIAHQPTSPAAVPAPAVTDAIVTAEKTPAELEGLRDKLATKAAVPARGSNGYAEPKHITAKPEGNMSFAESGEVSVSAPATLDARVQPQSVQNLPLPGRNVAELKQMSPATISAAPTPRSSAGTGSGLNGRAVGGRVGGVVGTADWGSADLITVPPRKDRALYGYVAGTISDASGAVIPNVKVTALGPLGTRTATSDQAGKYAIDQLAAGSYSLKFDAPGFQETQLQQVAVLADKASSLNVKLNPGAMTETVAVTAAPSVVAQSQQQIAAENYGQQQTSNQIQAQALEVEAMPVRIQKAAKNKGNANAMRQTVAKTLAIPVWQWSLSPQGAVQRSSDNGKTWQSIALNESSVFRAISSVGPDVWVGGNSGSLYHTADSGQHWAQIVPSINGDKLQSDITYIQCADPQHVLLATSTTQTWSTTDGGKTWSRK